MALDGKEAAGPVTNEHLSIAITNKDRQVGITAGLAGGLKALGPATKGHLISTMNDAVRQSSIAYSSCLLYTSPSPRDS